MVLDSATVQALVLAGQPLPNLSALPTKYSAYLISEGSVANDRDAFAVLDAMHACYDANRAQLLLSHQQRQAQIAALEAQAAQARAHPAPPQDTAINFWPKKNSVFLNPRP